MSRSNQPTRAIAVAQQPDDRMLLHYAALVQSSLDAIISSDLNGLVTSWNPAAEEIFGYSAEEMIGNPLRTLFPPEQIPDDERILTQILSGERVAQFETTRRRKDGTLLPVSLTVSPIQDAAGHIVGASTIASSIAEHKKAEARLVETQRRTAELLAILETVLASAPVGFAFVDLSYRYVLVNETMAAMHNLPVSAHLGRTVQEVAPHLWCRLEPIYRTVLDTGQPSLDREWRDPAGGPAGSERIIVSSHYPVRSDGKLLGIGVVVFDITEKRRAEEQLWHAQRIEAIGNLTGGMAHDFNNLIGIVVLNLDLARESVAADDPVATLLQDASAAAWHGADLTRRLLAFARRQPLQPVRVDASHLVAATMHLLRRMLGGDIEVTLSLGDDLWPIVVDPAQLETSITNLVNNARDAMPRGGRLNIATGNREIDADYVAHHSYAMPGDYVLIEISDNGMGMAPETVGRIFEPFFTTKEPGKGTGLGLSMVFGFLKQSGGHVDVYSELGIGTTFRLYLPRATGAAATSVRPVPAPASRRLTGGERILVVDDNAAVRHAVLRQLRDLGYRTVEASSASMALDILASETFDLVLTDVVMPGDLNGVELARVIEEEYPGIRVVLTSGFPEIRIKNGDIPANLLMLTKPYSKDTLARTLREVLDG